VKILTEKLNIYTKILYNGIKLEEGGRHGTHMALAMPRGHSLPSKIGYHEAFITSTWVLQHHLLLTVQDNIITYFPVLINKTFRRCIFYAKYHDKRLGHLQAWKIIIWQPSGTTSTKITMEHWCRYIH